MTIQRYFSLEIEKRVQVLQAKVLTLGSQTTLGNQQVGNLHKNVLEKNHNEHIE